MLTDITILRAALLAYPGANEDFPFGPDSLVSKVGGRMFSIIALTAQPLRISLKCDPLDAQLLRDQYDAIIPGYHLNKQHWNTIILDGSLPDILLQQLIGDSYRLVYKGLPKAIQRQVSNNS